MKFRIFVLKDPHAEVRGFTLKGIKVPLRDWCPITWNDDIATFNGKKLERGPYREFWTLHCEDVLNARPELEKFLKRVDTLLIPTEFCDVQPVDLD